MENVTSLGCKAIHVALQNRTLPIGSYWVHEDGTGCAVSERGTVAFDNAKDLEEISIEIQSFIDRFSETYGQDLCVRDPEVQCFAYRAVCQGCPRVL